MLAAASGALAIMMIVAIVVTVTPSQSEAPMALSATTTPIRCVRRDVVDQPPAEDEATPATPSPRRRHCCWSA